MRNITSLRQLLRSLCHNTRWDYAVFWKLKQEKKILTWQGGYFDDAKKRLKLEDSPCDQSLHFNPGMISFVDSEDAQDRSCHFHPLKVALDNMKCHHYALGEGFIGKVALTEGHYWIFPGDLKSEVQSELYKEWQLSAEVKTIVLVAVAHYGVVQLGSLEMVAEDSNLVVHIKDLFCTRYHDLVAHDSSDLMSPVNVTCFESNSTAIFGSLASSQPQQLLTIEPNILPFFMVDHNSPSSPNCMDQILDTEIVGTDENAITARYDYLWSAFTEEPQILDYPNTISEGNMSEFSFTENETKVNVQSDPIDYISIITQEHHVCDLSGKDMTYKEAEKNCPLKTNSIIDCKFRSFPIESELHEALGITSMEELDDCFLDTSLPKDERSISSITTFRTVGSDYLDHTFDEGNAWLNKESDADLLDAVVSSLHCTLDDDVFEEKFWRTFSNNCSDKLFDSSLGEGENESSILDLGSLLPTSQQTCSSLSKTEGLINSPTSSCKSICMSTNENNNIHMPKGHNGRKLPLINKKGKNGNSHKPRPRDRQLIQDRVKELRELIPNGSKCSIDTLLDRTVSHMLFLQSISSQAEKLKQTAHPEVKREVQNSGKPQNQANGANSATEHGSQPEIWPIVVEYLDQPGQILVEVLCNDYGLFLEIAHVIRRLDLTILKGVLESRSDKLWAHFVIEVSRGFHRMHILWPLMQLLQQNYAPVPNKF
ncbi:transcription factor LHW isoform X1 [Canna indica]|uniref:Transcription factor LHW isoform X1 n=1 Tax=Canna indica TaxID=4628 RepID=A0AAQ3JXC8_9LILI|nr:transcription factor LHW isoform X1 [Canna indica]